MLVRKSFNLQNSFSHMEKFNFVVFLSHLMLYSKTNSYNKSFKNFNCSAQINIPFLTWNTFKNSTVLGLCADCNLRGSDAPWSRVSTSVELEEPVCIGFDDLA